MAKQVIPRQQGDDYQARVFWLNACKLLIDKSGVVKVDYESLEVPFFDDVVVYYNGDMIDNFGNPYKMDCYQIKFHVTQNNPFGFKELTEDKFTGTSKSILQKLKTAKEKLAPNGYGAKFFWAAPKGIHPDDPLIDIISNVDYSIRHDKLCTSDGISSRLCQIRDTWLTHLEISDLEELRNIIRPFRLYSGSSSLMSLQEQLNLYLIAAGLVPVRQTSNINIYDDLIKKLYSKGINSFTRDKLIDICEQEGLFAKTKAPAINSRVMGVRSFVRPYSDIRSECDNHICLLRYFDDRELQEKHSWQTTIFKEVDGFFKQCLDSSQPLSLILDCHSSISFACGYLLDTKCGLDISVLQHPRNGKRINWHPNTGNNDYPNPLWSIEEQNINSDGSELAVGISVTHDVANDLILHTTNSVSNVSRALHLKINPSAGYDSIKDGKHAALLATDIVKLIRGNATTKERQGIIHLFIAAPNALVFFLGQVARSIGAVQLYEYNFGRSLPGDYQPTLKVPM